MRSPRHPSRRLRAVTSPLLALVVSAVLVVVPLTRASSAVVAPCQSTQLNAIGGRQGESGAVSGVVVLVNVSATTCRLSGAPRVRVLYPNGTPLDHVSYVAAHVPTTSLRLEPQGEGQLLLAWSNWCRGSPGALSVRVTLAGRAGSLTASFDGPPASAVMPNCVSSSQRSTLRVTAGYQRSSVAVPACSITNFSGTINADGTALGATQELVTLLNRGPVCVMGRLEARGFSVSDNTPVGRWAKLLALTSSSSTSTRPGLLTAQGAEPHAQLSIEHASNYPKGSCQKVTVDAFEVAFRGHRASTIPLTSPPVSICRAVIGLGISAPTG